MSTLCPRLGPVAAAPAGEGGETSPGSLRVQPGPPRPEPSPEHCFLLRLQRAPWWLLFIHSFIFVAAENSTVTSAPGSEPVDERSISLRPGNSGRVSWPEGSRSHGLGSSWPSECPWEPRGPKPSPAHTAPLCWRLHSFPRPAPGSDLLAPTRSCPSVLGIPAPTLCSPGGHTAAAAWGGGTWSRGQGQGARGLPASLVASSGSARPERPGPRKSCRVCFSGPPFFCPLSQRSSDLMWSKRFLWAVGLEEQGRAPCASAPGVAGSTRGGSYTQGLRVTAAGTPQPRVRVLMGWPRGLVGVAAPVEATQAGASPVLSVLSFSFFSFSFYFFY